jgi:glycosyltransferase involved in cell wall biosynthesis
VALNVDGIERQRAKWGLAGRVWYIVGERLALVLPDAIVSDAEVIRDYYRDRFGKPSDVITYGAALPDREPPPDLARHGLDGIVAGRYLLYVSRLEPENQADVVIEGYRTVPGDLPLVVVGDAPYAGEYKARLSELAQKDPRVRLTGGLYGDVYRDLQRGALAYIHATSVGGTHPALIEAMGAANLVLTYSSPENVEVAGGTALLFGSAAELSRLLTRVVAAPCAPELEALRTAARARVSALYSWEAVTDAYESLFERIIAGR